jgi:hypothetical protein
MLVQQGDDFTVAGFHNQAQLQVLMLWHLLVTSWGT